MASLFPSTGDPWIRSVGMDSTLLVPAMTAGASMLGPKVGEIVGAEVIKEMTKDAYKALKASLTLICGRKVERAAESVEADSSSDAARAGLALAISDIPDDGAADVEEKLNVLLAALKEDKVALRVAETVASIKLDIDSGGHVRLSTIKGARTIDVKSKSVGDFDFGQVEMGTEASHRETEWRIVRGALRCA